LYIIRFFTYEILLLEIEDALPNEAELQILCTMLIAESDIPLARR